MASIAAAAQRIKQDGAAFISEALVNEACVAAGHRWRDRVLTPLVLLRLFALQVLAGNVACRAVRMLSDLSFTTQAYCNGRMNLPVDVLGHVATALTHEARRKVADVGRWKGHRLLHIDGTGLSSPDTPALQKTCGQPARQLPGAGFPVMHVLWLFDQATGLIDDFIVGRCHTHDMAHAAALHTLMNDGDVLVGDRAFGTFAHLALLLQQKCHGLFRGHQRQIFDFTPGRKHKRQRRKSQRKGVPTSRWLRRLGRDDQLVEYHKPVTRPTWMTPQEYKALPATLVVRELRYTITRPGFRTHDVTLVTTLTDPRKYPRQDLIDLYAARWQIETNLRHLKTTMRMDVLRSKTPEGIQKELWMYLIIYNQVRLLMLDAATRQGVAADRISFIDALDAWRHRGPRAAMTLNLIVNPLRPDRREPRVIKRRKDRYTYMTRPRDELRKSLGITKNAA